MVNVHQVKKEWHKIGVVEKKTDMGNFILKTARKIYGGLEITQIYLGYQNVLRVFWRCLSMKFEVFQLRSIIRTKKEDYAIRMD